MSDVAKIAGSLSAEHRDAVLERHGSRATCCDILALEPSVFDQINLEGLRGRLSLITPFGKRLVAHLLSEESNG